MSLVTRLEQNTFEFFLTISSFKEIARNYFPFKNLKLLTSILTKLKINMKADDGITCLTLKELLKLSYEPFI